MINSTKKVPINQTLRTNNLNNIFQKIMLDIEQYFFLTIKTIIEKIILQYPPTPLEWMDIYYSFLNITPFLVFSFDVNLGLKFKTYLGVQCKFFTKTYMKSFITNKFKVLNESYSFDYDFISANLNDANENEPDWLNFEIDKTTFTTEEFLVFNKRYLENKKLTLIQSETNLKYHQINTLSKAIKSKIKQQINKTLKQNKGLKKSPF